MNIQNKFLNMDTWFPETIGVYFNINHKEHETELIKRCAEIQEENKEQGGKNWISKVYNTNNTVDLKTEEVFKPVLDFQQQCVERYSDDLQMMYGDDDYNPKLSGSWFNTYFKNDFQEYHLHESIISTIYFVTCDKNDSRTVFKSQRYETHPINYGTNYRPAGRAFYEPTPGKLLVFRSHLEHCVEQKTTEKPRITLASNYT